jgi:hypothetical protein
MNVESNNGNIGENSYEIFYLIIGDNLINLLICLEVNNHNQLLLLLSGSKHNNNNNSSRLWMELACFGLYLRFIIHDI